ncbi:MAG: hypothetical protein KGR26_03155 [Cyanobacteria bacterium REEB65]|nr:hypothetical protein [Cyanobacteria bacterium REEB65]
MTANPELFGRIYQLTVGPAGGEGRQWSNQGGPSLRMRFKVSKSGDSTPNKAEIEVYNLSADSRRYIDSYNPKTWAMQLSAGYQATGLQLLFSGAIELASNEKAGHRASHHQGPDWMIKIQGKDGVHAYCGVVLADSFGPDTSEEAVVRHVAKQLGVTIGTIKGLSKARYAHGRALSGAARYELDALCKSRGLRWSIQDGVLQILPSGQGLDLTAFVIGPATGLVGSPERTETGVKFTSLLQGGINPGRLIQLESAYLKGLYVAENVDHTGDTHDYPWYTTVDAFRAS